MRKAPPKLPGSQRYDWDYDSPFARRYHKHRATVLHRADHWGVYPNDIETIAEQGDLMVTSTGIVTRMWFRSVSGHGFGEVVRSRRPTTGLILVEHHETGELWWVPDPEFGMAVPEAAQETPDA